MGIGEAIGNNMKKNMQEQMQFQKELILKQRQMQMATQIAMARERFWYFQWFYYVAAIGLLVGSLAQKKPKILAPLVPLSFAYAFQYDMCYGRMMERAMETADTLIVEHPLKFALPVHSGIVDS